MDYTLTDGTATITAGSSSTNISIPIVNEDLVEDSETVIITLSSPSNAILDTNTTHTLTITDDDNMNNSGSSAGFRKEIKTNDLTPNDCASSYKFSPSTGKPCLTSTSLPSPSTNPPQSVLEPSKPSKPQICTITQTLKLGSTGKEVKCLQTYLNIVSDGSFGPKTKKAVILFQKNHPPLVPDGIFGPKSILAWTKGV